jgi:hypothetical protein
VCGDVTSKRLLSLRNSTVRDFPATSASSSILNIPGQAGPIIPILQAQDGSFFGTVGTGPQPGQITQTYMISFNGSGNQNWSVPNDSPKIATADGGVIGTSGATYDSNGRAIGRIATAQIGSIPTLSWTGTAYESPLEQFASLQIPVATTFVELHFTTGMDLVCYQGCPVN